VATFIQRRPSVRDPEWYLREIRARGFTLEQFASKAGISRKTLGNWLSGRRSCHIRTEWKVFYALGEEAVLIPLDGAQPWRREVPKQGQRLLESIPRSNPGEPSATGRRAPTPEAYLAALAAVPALEAWIDHGYRLLPSGRATSAFRRDLAESRPWLAFPEAYGDEAGYRSVAGLDFRPLWP
jgi:transcriptional regulator with XRE-family HTH domain